MAPGEEHADAGGAGIPPGRVARPLPVHHGKFWSMEECELLVERLIAGEQITALAEHHGRTTGGIQARLALMIPAEANVWRGDAAAWLRHRFASGTYDWRAILLDRLKGPRTLLPAVDPASVGTAISPAEAPAAPVHTSPRSDVRNGSSAVQRVLRIWQDIAGLTLSADQAARFAQQQEVEILGSYDDSRLQEAASDLYTRIGKLPLPEWARECAWPGGGTAHLEWKDFTSPSPDAAITLRDLLSAVLSVLPQERSRNIMVARLGLDGEPARTFQTLGEQIGRSRERVRQIQERAIDILCRRGRRPTAATYVGLMLKKVLDQAATSGSDLAQAVASLVEVALPSATFHVAARVLLRLAGYRRLSTPHIAAEAYTIAIARRAELLRAARREANAARDRTRVERLLEDVEWPITARSTPDRSLIAPQREHAEREGAGVWPSTKLGRDVGYDSMIEFYLIQLLDRASNIRWYCEQPIAVGYELDGRRHTYYPDLIAVTDDDRTVLIEVKPVLDMALTVNRVKADAARAFCAVHGWGYLATDGNRTLRSLLKKSVPPQAAQDLETALSVRGVLRWRETEPIRTKHGITGLHLAILALNRGWDIRLNPYLIIDRSVAAGTSRR